MRICQVTTVHSRHDTRVFLKECRSLFRAGNDVTLVVADGRGYENKDGVHIVDIGNKPRGKISRMLFSLGVMRKALQKIDAEVFHFHDPELLPVASAFAKAGCKVIYDSHEDLPRQLLAKDWAPRWLLALLAPLLEIYENGVARRISAVVAATEGIRDRFSAIGANSSLVRNYPIVEEFAAAYAAGDVSGSHGTRRGACYVGGIFANRGAHEMVAAAALSGITLRLAGPFKPAALEREMLARASRAELISIEGFLDRQGVARLLSECQMGLVTLADLPNYRESLPIKLFEYMAAGLPVIASDFPSWRVIVEEGGCGLCVDASSPEAIADAMREIASDALRAAEMGERGRRLVAERYNWNLEEKSLLDLYSGLGQGA
ncbi:MAG: glycosyltransferase family 4 protein [Rectinemataceae bacterium]